MKNTELPLIDDIRLLGKILGDIVREQEGDSVYGLVEQVRKLSVISPMMRSGSGISARVLFIFFFESVLILT